MNHSEMASKAMEAESIEELWQICAGGLSSAMRSHPEAMRLAKAMFYAGGLSTFSLLTQQTRKITDPAEGKSFLDKMMHDLTQGGPEVAIDIVKNATDVSSPQPNSRADMFAELMGRVGAGKKVGL